MIENDQLWQSALAELEVGVSKANFGTWFRNTSVVKQDTGIIHIGVPNAFVKDWLANKYHKSILKSLRALAPEVRAIEYTIIKYDQADKANRVDLGVKSPFANQMEIGELYIDKADNLNPRYIFDSFVVGSFNELAHAAAQGVVKKLGRVYNPLFVYGGTGLGKTHLIQAVGNVIKHAGGKKVYYVTSEQFVIDYISAVQNNRPNVFKNKYRDYDVLIMDDVQFLSKKVQSQEELFHLFNHFHENNKQIIFSSDIKTKLHNSAFYPSNEVIDYLANIIQDNIRELEGSLNSIVCQSQLKNRNLSLPEVKVLLKDSIRPKKLVSIKNVAGVVAEFYNINEKMLYEKTRKKEVVKPRQVIMYLLREDFNSSYPYIGQKLGGRDHTTVIHAYDKIKNDLKGDNLLGQEIEQIRTLLYSE
ncbi:MAG: chromosomal replication initiator protein DnaA [Candidatus Vogelbacteria bacterium]|nr:chromosomal replication initiator protein DnaA [Candidatus Vogelbacteria bacterium]